MEQTKLIIATTKSWNLLNAIKFKHTHLQHDIRIISTLNKDIIFELNNSFKPDYIFFPHWSNIIPPEIWQNYNCVVFHMTDLPFGRGGSPLQNLISRKIYKTKISAIKVNGIIDGGDVYCKVDFDITTGNVDSIFKAASYVIFNTMIPYIIKNNPMPIPQSGNPVYFTRRTPEQSDMTNVQFNDAYDRIRMLDGEGYPPAFVDTSFLRIEFKNAKKIGNKINGDFEIYKK